MQKFVILCACLLLNHVKTTEGIGMRLGTGAYRLVDEEWVKSLVEAKRPIRNNGAYCFKNKHILGSDSDRR